MDYSCLGKNQTVWNHNGPTDFKPTVWKNLNETAWVAILCVGCTEDGTFENVWKFLKNVSEKYIADIFEKIRDIFKCSHTEEVYKSLCRREVWK